MKRLTTFVRLLVGTPLLLLAFWVLGPLALSGCAPRPVPALTIPVPESLREPCPRPDPAKVATVGDLAAFSIEQEAALGVCDVRRAAAVQIIDAANERPKPVSLWRRLLPP